MVLFCLEIPNPSLFDLKCPNVTGNYPQRLVLGVMKRIKSASHLSSDIVSIILRENTSKTFGLISSSFLWSQLKNEEISQTIQTGWRAPGCEEGRWEGRLTSGYMKEAEGTPRPGWRRLTRRNSVAELNLRRDLVSDRRSIWISKWGKRSTRFGTRQQDCLLLRGLNRETSLIAVK